MHPCCCRLKGGPSSKTFFQYGCRVQEDVASWGHEYIRSLSGEIGEEYHVRREKGENVEDLLGLVAQIVPFHMTHNAGKLLLYAHHSFILHDVTVHPASAADTSGPHSLG